MKTDKIRYGSVCSGIEAATVAWHPLGWTPAWFSEIEKFPSAVLAHHYPNVTNMGDMTTLKERLTKNERAIDLLVGGTPCQSFSVAGLRKGLADPRGNLALVFLALLDHLRPKWMVWENVPGVLSSGEGRDFGSFLGGLGQLGYGFAYRVLDAQYFGVPQRRRRVFVVGYLGDWRRAAAVLFERESLSGNPPPSRKAGQGSATGVGKCLESRSQQSGRCDPTAEDYVIFEPRSQDGVARIHKDQAPTLNTAQGGQRQTCICFDTTQVTSEKNFSNPKPGDPCHPLAKGQHAPAIAFTQNQAGDVLSGAVSPSMGTNQNATGRNTPKVAVAFNSDQSEKTRSMGEREDQTPTLRAGGEVSVATAMQVRRLTPRECERLQGFPDDYTLIPYRGGSAADGPRYKALGNSMAVPVMRWIGERIEKVEAA